MATITLVTENYGACWQCGGSGHVYSQDPNATVSSGSEPCARCTGTGQIIVSRTIRTEESPDA